MAKDLISQIIAEEVTDAPSGGEDLISQIVSEEVTDTQKPTNGYQRGVSSRPMTAGATYVPPEVVPRPVGITEPTVPGPNPNLALPGAVPSLGGGLPPLPRPQTASEIVQGMVQHAQTQPPRPVTTLAGGLPTYGAPAAGPGPTPPEPPPPEMTAAEQVEAMKHPPTSLGGHIMTPGPPTAPEPPFRPFDIRPREIGPEGAVNPPSWGPSGQVAPQTFENAAPETWIPRAAAAMASGGVGFIQAISKPSEMAVIAALQKADKLEKAGKTAEAKQVKVENTVSNLVDPIGTWFEQYAASVTPDNPNWADKLGEGAASMALFMIPAVAAGRATSLMSLKPLMQELVGEAWMAGLEAVQEAGSSYRQMISEGMDPDSAMQRTALSFGLNFALIARTNQIAFFENVERAGFKGRIERAYKQFISEGVFQEGPQEVIQEVVPAKSLSDLASRIKPGNIAESTVVGGAVGSIAGGAFRGPKSMEEHGADIAAAVQAKNEYDKAMQPPQEAAPAEPPPPGGPVTTFADMLGIPKGATATRPAKKKPEQVQAPAEEPTAPDIEAIVKQVTEEAPPAAEAPNLPVSETRAGEAPAEPSGMPAVDRARAASQRAEEAVGRIEDLARTAGEPPAPPAVQEEQHAPSPEAKADYEKLQAEKAAHKKALADIAERDKAAEARGREQFDRAVTGDRLVDEETGQVYYVENNTGQVDKRGRGHRGSMFLVPVNEDGTFDWDNTILGATWNYFVVPTLQHGDVVPHGSQPAVAQKAAPEVTKEVAPEAAKPTEPVAPEGTPGPTLQEGQRQGALIPLPAESVKAIVDAVNTFHQAVGFASLPLDSESRPEAQALIDRIEKALDELPADREYVRGRLEKVVAPLRLMLKPENQWRQADWDLSQEAEDNLPVAPAKPAVTPPAAPAAKPPTKAAMVPTRGGIKVVPLDEKGEPVPGAAHIAGEKPPAPVAAPAPAERVWEPIPTQKPRSPAGQQVAKAATLLMKVLDQKHSGQWPPGYLPEPLAGAANVFRDALRHAAIAVPVGAGLRTEALKWVRLKPAEATAPAEPEAPAKTAEEQGFTVGGFINTQPTPKQPIKGVAPADATTKYDTPEIVELRKAQATKQDTSKINTPERQKMRKDLENKYYGNGATTKGRRLDLVLGLPGSGKTTTLETPLAQEHGSLVIGSDPIKQDIPESDGGKYNGAVHAESSMISDAIYNKAVAAGDNIVLPITGKNANRVREIVGKAKDAGYTVHAHFMHATPDQAAERVVSRTLKGLKSGGPMQFVDPWIVLHEFDTHPREAYDTIKNEGGFDSYETWDNTGARGSEPQLVESSPGVAERPGEAPAGEEKGPGNLGAPEAATVQGAVQPGNRGAGVRGRTGGSQGQPGAPEAGRGTGQVRPELPGRGEGGAAAPAPAVTSVLRVPGFEPGKRVRLTQDNNFQKAGTEGEVVSVRQGPDGPIVQVAVDGEPGTFFFPKGVVEPITKGGEPRGEPKAQPAQPKVPAGPTRTTGQGPLERVPTENVPGAPEVGRPGPEPVRGPGENAGPHGPVVEGGPTVSPGVGAGEPGVRIPAGGRAGAEETAATPGTEEPAAGGGPATKPARPESRPLGRDLRIIPAIADELGLGSPRQKAKRNIDAIRLLKEIEQAGRPATDEEKAVLVQYVGWGGIAQALDPYALSIEEDVGSWEERTKTRRQWAAVQEELLGILTSEEFDSAKRSTPNAHYTSPLIVRAQWRALQRLGIQAGGRMLEPGMGVGHFFGLMPEELIPGTRRTGIELDSITGRIAKLLYPEANIHVNGFESVKLPDNFFDVAMSNVPFGNYGIHDPQYRRTPAVLRSIHNYFFAKSLDKVRPGGVVSFITSRYTMDEQDTTIRQYLSSQADFIGAIRLPNTTFKAGAGTVVTTDIIFLQKRAPGQEAKGQTWEETTEITGKDGKPLLINEYFARHPEMMLGEMSTTGTMYREAEPTLEGAVPTDESLDAAISHLPANVLTNWQAPSEGQVRGEDQLAPEHIKDGAFTVKDGVVVRRVGSYMEPVVLQPKAAARVRGMIEIRDAARAVLSVQKNNRPDDEIVKAREHLNKVYDKFVKSHGYLNEKPNRRVFSADPDAQLLMALEKYDEDAGKATKTDIFSKDLEGLGKYKPVQAVDTASEALAVSLNELGRLDWMRMQELTGRGPQELQDELGPLIYRNPEGNAWEPQDLYLSGNVRAKLALAQAAAAADPKFQRNVDALKAVQPKELEPGDIGARLGSPWIVPQYIADFLGDLLDVSPAGRIQVSYAVPIATWLVKLNKNIEDSVENTTTHGTGRMYASDLIEMSLNGKTPTVKDRVSDADGNERYVVNQDETTAAREKQKQIQERFATWLWKNPQRSDMLTKIYNELHNTETLRQFDGSFLTFPGMNKSVLRAGDLDKHQKDAVARQLFGGSTLLAHEVGAGKTYEMIAAAMEMRRLGLAKKPIFVVPNHLSGQTAQAFLSLYPSSNILVAGKKDLQKGNRQRFMARIATGNWDSVIVTYRQFEALPVSDETFNRFLKKELDDLESYIIQARAGGERNIVKELEKAKRRLEKKLRDHAKREAKDVTLNFEELGVDSMFVDEADSFKNLYYTTKMGRIAGLPKSESDRAFDMYIKVRHTAERNGGNRGVTFATGTPISNTMAEMFTMSRYLRPDLLEAKGVSHFDAWAASFGNLVTAWEVNLTGSGIRQATRFAEFVNLPEVIKMFRTFSDVKTADELKLPRPALKGGKHTLIVIPGSPALKEKIKELDQRADAVRGQGRDAKGNPIAVQRPDPKEDNMLKISTEGRKAALDMRLVGGQETPQSKLNSGTEEIYNRWKAGRKDRTTQVVFIDMSTPEEPANRGKVFTMYDALKTKLLKKGVPEAEIAFIHDAVSQDDKQRLFDAVNAGRVRIILGSTEKMGAGTNIQERLYAAHHIDIGWRPRDVLQRDGRILRPGNTNAEVEIVRYVTEGSFDAYMWQTLETKTRYITQAMSGDLSVRRMADIEAAALTPAEVKAIATGNPMMIEKTKVDSEIARLGRLRAHHETQQARISQAIEILPKQIEQQKKYAENLAADLATYNQAKAATPEFLIVLNGEVYTGKGARDKADSVLAKIVFLPDGTTTIGTYMGFEIEVQTVDLSKKNGYQNVRLRGAMGHYVQVASTRGLDGVLFGIAGEEAHSRGELKNLQDKLAGFQKEEGKPFEHTAELAALDTRQQQLLTALDLKSHDHQAADADPVADEDEDVTVTEAAEEDNEEEDQGPCP